MRDLDYETNHVGYDEQYKEGGIKCKNYEVCNAVLPTWWFECKSNYLCTNCHMGFGKELTFYENKECSICLESKKSVSYLHCNHCICTDCFKRCFYGDDTGHPSFPYPEIEDEYFEDYENPKWIDYPLIQLYHNQVNIWEDRRIEKYENEQYLRVCSLCRKS